MSNEKHLSIGKVVRLTERALRFYEKRQPGCEPIAQYHPHLDVIDLTPRSTKTIRRMH